MLQNNASHHPLNEENPFAAWTTLIQEAFTPWAADSPALQQPAGVVGADQWSALIDRLWQLHPASRILPIDPAEMSRAFGQLWGDALRHPGRSWTRYVEFVQRYTEVMTATALKAWGVGHDAGSMIAPEPGDKRFSAPDWEQNALFTSLKQSYLLAATTLLKTAAEMTDLDDAQQRRLTFYLRQFLDAISPTNFAFTNPEVIHAALASGGQSLVTGMDHLLRDLAAGQLTMTDTNAFAPGRNLALTPGQVVYRNELIELIQYESTTEKVAAIPLLIIPPWINKYYIMDLKPENSLIRFLVEQGFTVFVVSWKNPDAAMESVTFENYLEWGPLAAMEVIEEITGSPTVHPVGYCVGGTLLAMTLAYLAATGRAAAVEAATFFVSLQDFSQVGDTAVFIDEPQVAYMEEQMLERGYLDSREMASMFNMLRANDLIWSNVVNNYLLGKEPPAFDLLYWNADGTRMTAAAHSFYLRNTYLENNLVHPDRMVVKGVPIDLGRIEQDLYAVGAEQDHIVPWQAAWQLSRLAGGSVRFALGASGHIAGIINPPTKGRGYWLNEQPGASADQWRAGATRHQGSWWTDWVAWLRPRSGKLVAPPPLGSQAHPPLMPAPGSYVLEK